MTEPTTSQGMSDALHALARERRGTTLDEIKATLHRSRAPLAPREDPDDVMRQTGAYRTSDGEIVIGDPRATQ